MKKTKIEGAVQSSPGRTSKVAQVPVQLNVVPDTNTTYPVKLPPEIYKAMADLDLTLLEYRQYLIEQIEAGVIRYQAQEDMIIAYKYLQAEVSPEIKEKCIKYPFLLEMFLRHITAFRKMININGRSAILINAMTKRWAHRFDTYIKSILIHN